MFLIIGYMKRRLTGEGALSNLIKRYFSRSDDTTQMLPLSEVLSTYSGAVFLLLIIVFLGSALYFFVKGEMVPGIVISVIGILLLVGSGYRNTKKK